MEELWIPRSPITVTGYFRQQTFESAESMKIILSRKGFDSSYGGIPSPILPDGRLISLPIPSSNDRATLSDINCPAVDIGKLIGDLSKGKHSLQTPIHLDPDLDRPMASRLTGWRPSLGQTGAAQSHLAGMGVGAGDVFLFFGWFRETEQYGGSWRYVKGAPDLHAIFGWLEVAEVLPIVLQRTQCLNRHPWIANHPHVANPICYSNPRNTLYVARERSVFAEDAQFGGGHFVRFNESLRLTKVGNSRSVWSLPSWFAPNGRKPLSYHPNASSWQDDGDKVTLRSAAKGQEFVIDSASYPEVEHWANSIVESGSQ